MFNLKKNKHFLPIAILVVIVSTAFWNIDQIFFQQDEWFGLGNFFSFRASGGFISFLKASFLPEYQVSRYVPFVGIVNYIVFYTFQKNAMLYGFLALCMAIINCILLYLFVYKLTKLRIVALFSSLLWVTNNLAIQSITWIGTMLPSQFSLLFFLMGLNYIASYQEDYKGKKLLLSSFFIAISVLLKEQGIYYLAPFLLLAFLDNTKRTTVKEIFTRIFTISMPTALFLLMPRIINSLRGYAANLSPALDPSSSANVIFNIFLLPARSIAHIFLSPDILYRYIYQAVQTHYPNILDGSVVETMGGDVFSLLLSFYIICALLLISFVLSANQRKIVFIALASFFASTIPFVLYKNENAILEPRYYTHLALWASLIVSFCVYTFFSKVKRVGAIVATLLLSVVLINNISGVKRSLAEDIITGEYRKNILLTVSQVKSELGNNNIFYFYSDSSGFYEFQSGFGQTLAVWFYDTGKIPQKALKDLDFWDPSYEGVKNYPEGKYGYFMTYDKLLLAVKENDDINLNSVLSFYWEPQGHTVTNVSDDVRVKLESDLGR